MNAHQRRRLAREGSEKAKSIPTRPVLEFLRDLPFYEGDPTTRKTGTWLDYEPRPDNTVVRAMPEGTPSHVVLAKMRDLIKRDLVDGCACGCRGGFALTPYGRDLLKGAIDFRHRMLDA